MAELEGLGFQAERSVARRGRHPPSLTAVPQAAGLERRRAVVGAEYVELRSRDPAGFHRDRRPRGLGDLRRSGRYAKMAVVVAYRMTPRGVGYAIAGVAAFSILSGAVGGLGASRGIGGDALFAALLALGVAAPLALVAWTRGLEVRVCDAGIMSFGLRTVAMIRWQELERFEVDRFRASPFAVYAVLGDGSRVALEALRGGSTQGGRVEQLRHELEAKLDERTRRADDALAGAAWPRVPVGWRRRARLIETQAH